MGRIQAKRIGPVAYYLYKDAKSSHAGKPALHTKFGPYASMKEAEEKREKEESRPAFVVRAKTQTNGRVFAFPQWLRSQGAFAALSVCDRNAFA
jgi:hypothetical protein